MMQNPDKICFSIGSINVYWYGVLMASGIVIAMLLANLECKRKKLYTDAIVDLCLWIIPMGIIGARLYYVLFSWKTYAANPISALYIWEGGLAFYGSAIGGMIGLLIFAYRKKLRALRLLDCIAPGLVLAQAIGRWGNFFNQEAFGLAVTPEMLTRFPALQYFPLSVLIDGPHSFDGVYCTNPIHLATFFYESAWCFLVFILLWSLRKKFKHDGDSFLTYAMVYGFERMFVEGLRGDSLYLIKPETVSWLSGGVRVSQMLSAVMVVGIAAFFIIRSVREKKTGELIWPKPETEFAADTDFSEIAAQETVVNIDADEETSHVEDEEDDEEDGEEDDEEVTEEETANTEDGAEV